MSKFKEIWQTLPLLGKGLSILFVMVFFVLIWSNWNTYKGKTDEMKEMEVEILILKSKLKEQREITDKYREIADSLAVDWEKFNVEDLENEIKEKYEKKRSDVLNLPIDSTIRDLSEWLGDE